MTRKSEIALELVAMLRTPFAAITFGLLLFIALSPVVQHTTTGKPLGSGTVHEALHSDDQVILLDSGEYVIASISNLPPGPVSEIYFSEIGGVTNTPTQGGVMIYIGYGSLLVGVALVMAMVTAVGDTVLRQVQRNLEDKQEAAARSSKKFKTARV